MIEVYKVVHNIYDPTVAPNLITNDISATRRNKYKLVNHTFNHNFRKLYFTARIVNMWNSLPDYIVDSYSVDV